MGCTRARVLTSTGVDDDAPRGEIMGASCLITVAGVMDRVALILQVTPVRQQLIQYDGPTYQNMLLAGTADCCLSWS